MIYLALERVNNFLAESGFFTDTLNMDWLKVKDIILAVILDFRVIIVAVCLVIYLNFVFLVVRYRKKSVNNQIKKFKSMSANPPVQTDDSGSDEIEADDE